MRVFLLLVTLVAATAAQTLEGTKPFTLAGDPAALMVEGISKFVIHQTSEGVSRRAPSRDRLIKILGVVDQRVSFTDPELVATVAQSALMAETRAFQVYAVRWPTLQGMAAEGLLFKPRGKVVARVVALPDADQIPEQLRASQDLAASGCEVLSPTLIDRNDTWSGNPRIRMTNQPHREFVYRMAFMVGRHPFAYEVQKTLAAVDWFAPPSFS